MEVLQIRKTYLSDLADPNKTYDHLENSDLNVSINGASRIAIVILVVEASGKRGKGQTLFCGQYKNIRFFRKDDALYNEAINSPLIKPIPNGNVCYKVDKDDHFFGKAL